MTNKMKRNEPVVERPISKLGYKILDVIENEFAGIAETGDIEAWMALTPRQIASALRPFVKSGKIKCYSGGHIFHSEKQFGGSIWKVV